MVVFSKLAVLVGPVAAIATAGAAFADSTLTFDAGDKGLIVESRGEDVRMGPASGDEGYVVMTQGSVYAITTTDDGPLVMDLGAMMESLSAMMPPGALDRATPAPQQEAEPTVTPTGRFETHAGVKGEVVVLTMPKSDPVEVVVTDDADVRAGFDAFQRLAQNLAADMPAALGGPAVIAPDVYVGDELAKRGVLRVGDTMTLIAIDRATPEAARFALPATPVTNPMQLMAR